MSLGKLMILAAAGAAAGLVAGGLIAAGMALAGIGAPPPAVAEARDDPKEDGRDGGAGPIRGIVVDEAGRPVAGARVRLLSTLGRSQAVTADDGSFSLATERYIDQLGEILAAANDRALQGTHWPTGIPKWIGTRDAPPIRIVLRPARPVTVRVTDGKGGPVPGAAVEVFDRTIPLVQAETDDAGRSRLRIPADAKVAWVVARKSGVGLDYFESYRDDPDRGRREGPLPEEVELVLNGARAVRARVLDSSGRTVPGIEIHPWVIGKVGKIDRANIGGGRTLGAKSDARGIATFDWLPADLTGRTTFESTDLHFYSSSPALDAESGAAEVTLRVLRMTRISGRVTRADGTPDEGAPIQAESPGSKDGAFRNGIKGLALTGDLPST